ncbi:MAG TPA: PLDc N-terminal domain-containing protein [Candidatus Polarisedimenticolia bacterium]|nr:PLDc N-terminal domain-containing protein [Candidatus Polarisedimenticolia bacterium]
MTGVAAAGFGLFGMLLAALSFVFWIWMLISAITNPRIAGGEKIAWVLVIILLNFLGALLYCLFGKSRR